MAIKIPIGRAENSATAGGSVKIPLNLGGGSKATVSSISPAVNEAKMVKAIAGGCAICDPKESVELARKDIDQPEDVIAPQVNEDALDELFDAAQKVIDDPAEAPALTDADNGVARRLGVDPRLVAAVRVAAEGNPVACEAGIQWAASINSEQLGKAARVGSRETQLDLIPTKAGRVESLEDEVDELTDALTDLQVQVAALEKICGQKSAGSSAQKSAQKK